MSRAGRQIALLERRPWTLAVLAGGGLTLLLPSAVALYGPPELLDSAVALGDGRLAAGLLGLFMISTAAFRLLLRRRRLAEESVDEEPPPRRHADPARDVKEAPAEARAHLR
jgi:hypothetical protein